ncbi:hypothetical protein LXL04_036669 [Taraxacum kok-saghyz]
MNKPPFVFVRFVYGPSIATFTTLLFPFIHSTPPSRRRRSFPYHKSFIWFIHSDCRWRRNIINLDRTKLTQRKCFTLLIFHMLWSISALFFLVISLNKYKLGSLAYTREVKRFVDLTTEETSDLWISAQKIGKQLENHHKASSLTFAIQDGPQAGQTVPHVHIHIVPRKGGDFENNDEIYDAIDEKEKELKNTLDLDKERKDRSME